MRTLRLLTLTCLLPLAAFAQSQPQTAAPPVAIDVENNVPVKMRDGIVLRADVYRPADDGRYPVLLTRSPYNKVNESGTCRKAAQRGYVCIAQDVRGRFASDGDWYTFRNEPNDGYDTVEWAAALPNSDGRVAMFGGSYVGATQWLAAVARPPHLVAIQPTVTASNYHDGWAYQGGALEQWFDESWTTGLAADTLRRAAESSKVKDLVPTLPLSSYPVLQVSKPAGLVPYYFDWLAHPDYDAYWKQWSIEEHYSGIAVASFGIGGWYDIFIRGTLRNYAGMRAHAATPWAREHQYLLIGPWFHGPMTGQAGEVDFGSAGALDRDTMLNWYDQLLKGAPPGKVQQRPVKIFVMGVNQWREEDDWPLARARSTRYYLHGGGHANSSSGDGALTSSSPRNEPADAFTYDPANPVPTHGGNLCCPNEQLPSGAFDQREVEKRNDVLVYTTLAFDKDFEVTGPHAAEIYISSSAQDTDVTAKLVDVWPNGFAQNLADSIQRLPYRDSPEKPELIQPGTIYKVTIDLGATSNVFRAGHRLRIEISSSNFPHFDRNLNTAESPEQGSKFEKAENRIYHDAAHPSAIVLPVIPAQ